MGYYTEHLSKTKEPKVVATSRLERGMVVILRYKPIDEMVSKPYLLFVLQPKFPKDSKGKLHALSLDNVKPEDFMKFAKDYNEVMATSTRVRKLNIPKLKIDKSSRRFYITEIKSNPEFKGAYRVFDLKRVGITSAVNYDYGKYDNI